MKRKPRRLLVILNILKKGSSRERERKHENRKDMKNYRENNYRCCCQFIFISYFSKISELMFCSFIIMIQRYANIVFNCKDLSLNFVCLFAEF